MFLPRYSCFVLLQCVVLSFSWASGNGETRLWLVLIRYLSMMLVPTAEVCVARASSRKVPVHYNLLILTPDSQILSALLHCYAELLVAFSHSHLKCMEFCKAFFYIAFLGIFYSIAWCHIECGFKETASLGDLLSPQGYV